MAFPFFISITNKLTLKKMKKTKGGRIGMLSNNDEELKNSVFYQNTTKGDSDLLGQRGLLVAQSAMNGATKKLTSLKEKLNGLNIQIESVKDLGKKSTDSLVPGVETSTFNGEAWFDNLNNLVIEKTKVLRQLCVAQMLYDQQFRTGDEITDIDLLAIGFSDMLNWEEDTEE